MDTAWSGVQSSVSEETVVAELLRENQREGFLLASSSHKNSRDLRHSVLSRVVTTCLATSVLATVAAQPAVQSGTMSSSCHVSSQKTSFGLKDRDRTKLQSADPSAQQAQDVALDLESSWSDENDSVVFEVRSNHDHSSLDHILYELSSDSDNEVIVLRRVPWGCEGRPGSPADEEEDIALDLETHLNIERASVECQTSNMAAQGPRRYLSSERGTAMFSPMWVDAKLSPSQKRAPAQSHMKQQQGFTTPFYPSGPNRGQCWRNVRGNNRSRMMVNRATHWPSPDTSPDSRSLHEFSKSQSMRMNVSHKGRGQTKSSCPRESGDMARQLNIGAQASALHLQGTPVTFASRRLVTNMETRPSRELGASPFKKVQNMAWAKGEGRPSYPGAGTVAGGLSRATIWKKEAENKKSLGRGSRVILGRAFPLWGQKVTAAPLEPAIFPAVMAIQIMGNSKNVSLLPSASQPSKQGATGKRSSVKQVREPQPVAREDKDPNSDSALQTKAGPYGLGMHHREFIHVEADARAPEAPAASQPLTLRQGGLLPRSSILTGDQETTVQGPTLERQQPPTGAQGCPQCLVLQKEIDNLKEQLAILQPFAAKFQML